MTGADYNGLLVRVAKLEKQSRFWKIVGVLVLLATVVSLTSKVGRSRPAPMLRGPR
jgi:hypothetical protein